VRINWDDSKSDKLKRERGFSLEEVSEIISVPDAVTDGRSDDPEQYYAIGFVKGRLITLIFETREDADGEFIWLVTYWKATKSEVKIYEQEKRK
jgi:uncharacterized DUF497 family protein